MASYGINNHFGWVRTRSAWKEMEYQRARRAEFAKQDQANMDAVNNTMSTALQNKISGLANLAGEAALKRVQTAAKAKLDAATKQIDDTQKLLGVSADTSSTKGASGVNAVA
jgi:hypothetical protein